MANIVVTPAVELHIDDFTSNVIADYTSGTVSGDGIFDIMMETATKHLQAQFEANRIRKEDYADAYIHIYEATLNAALKAWLDKDIVAAQIRRTEAETAKINAETALIEPQIAQIEAETAKTVEETKLLPVQLELAEAQLESEKTKLEIAKEQLKLVGAQVESETAKRALYKRQIEGFDEDYKHKILKVMMDSWAVGFSVAKDSFEASGIPAPMTKTAIDDIFNQYIFSELDKYTYGRQDVITT